MRLSIYGMEREEWYKLAQWVLTSWGGDFPGPVLSSHNRWIIQIPRLWRIYYIKHGEQRTFQDMLENIFTPIFQATLKPEENPEIAELLTHIVAFDSVDDEGSPEVRYIQQTHYCHSFTSFVFCFASKSTAHSFLSAIIPLWFSTFQGSMQCRPASGLEQGGKPFI